MTDPARLVIDRPGDFRVHTDAYVSPDVFDLETRRIFERTWVYVAHESQIPTAGDFVTTTIGRQPVIVTRGPQGAIHVLLNRCRHRGSIVCRLDRGHSAQFMCPYHNWVYAPDGALIAFAQKDGYPADLNRADLGLARAEVGVHQGLVFARLGRGGESFDERLADVRRYIDLWVQRAPAGRIRTTRAAHRIAYPGNWKFQMENGVDGYHGNYVHSSFMRLVERAGERKMAAVTAVRDTGGTRGLSRGDGMIERPYGGMAGQFDYADPRLSDYHALLDAAYGRARRDEILGQRNLLIFPNLFLFESHIRLIQPVSPTETIVTMLPTILEGAPDALNAARLRAHERFFGPAGFGTPDDVEMFVNCESGLQARGVDWVRMDRGVHREQHVGRDYVSHSTDEVPQRSAYRRWRELLSMAEAGRGGAGAAS